MDQSRTASGNRPLEPSVDLWFAAAFALVTCAVVVVEALRTSPVVFLFVLPTTLFVPGYVLSVALYPERAVERSSLTRSPSGGIDGIERATLSVALSVVVTPLVVLAVLLAGVELQPTPVVLALGAVVAGSAVVAARRRATLPAEDRYSIPLDEWARTLRGVVGTPRNRASLLVNLVLALAVVFAAGTVAYAVVLPDEGADTELYVLSENETGDLVAADYPTELQVDQELPLAVAIANHEGEPVTYTVVVQLQRVTGEEGSYSVTGRSTIDTFDASLGPGQDVVQRRTFAPTLTGDRLRLAILLYRGESPATPSIENAYRATYLWVTVSGATA